MRVVDEPVENGVGKRRIAYRGMPALDRNLTRDDCRAQSVAIIEDFEQIPSRRGQRRHRQIVHQEDIGLRPLCE